METNVDNQELRRFERFQIIYPGVLIDEEPKVYGRIENLSEGGVSFSLDEDLPRNGIRKLQIKFSPTQPDINLDVIIKWTQKIGKSSRVRVGMEYLNLPIQERQIIRNVLSHSAQGNIGIRNKVRIPGNNPLLSVDENVKNKAKWLTHRTGQPLHHISQYSFDPTLAQPNIENMVGACQIPVGIAGPLLVKGTYANGEYYVPLATTEGTLVDTYNYGMFVANKAGGICVELIDDVMDITPVFFVRDIREAKQLSIWIDGHFLEIKREAERTTTHGILRNIQTRIVSRHVYTTFYFTTGDAMGLNIACIAANQACRYVEKEFGSTKYYLRSDFSSDKKPAFINLFKPYGKELVADLTIPKQLVKKLFGITPEEVVKFSTSALIACAHAGMIGHNAHFANGLAALFTACGQDIAQVVNASIGLTHMEVVDEGKLYVSVKTPNIIVATLGGGTGLPTQRECLEIMDCYGPNKARKFAEITTATLLAGELTILSTLASGRFIEAHEKKRKLARPK